MVDYSNSNQKPITVSKAIKKSFSNFTGLRDEKKAVLKMSVAQLESNLQSTETVLDKAKGRVVELNQEIQSLQDNLDTMKTENSAHIDDLMEKLMEEQMARAEEKKNIEETIATLEKEAADKIAASQADSEEKKASLKAEMSEQLEATKELFEKDKELYIEEMNVKIEDRNDLISFYEKERRSLKKLTKLAKKALKKKLLGESAKKEAAPTEEVEDKEETPAAPAEEEPVTVELYTDFGSVEEEEGKEEIVAEPEFTSRAVDDIISVGDVVEEIKEEIEDAIDEKIEDIEDTIEDAISEKEEKIEEVQDKIETVEEIKEDVESVKEEIEEVKEAVEEKVEEVKEAVEEKVETVEEKAEDHKEAVEEKMEEIKEAEEEKIEETKEPAEEKVEDKRTKMDRVQYVSSRLTVPKF